MERCRYLWSRVKYLAAFMAAGVVRDARLLVVLPFAMAGCAEAPKPEARTVLDLTGAISSVVRVTAYGLEGNRMWSGSAVMIGPRRALTAKHCTGSDVAAYVLRSCTGAEVAARFVMASDGADWALLEADDPIGVPAELLPADVQPKVLSQVIAVGYAAALNDPTITFGHLQPYDGGLYRISAPIAPGNSGGGAFSPCHGRPVLIGLTVAVFAPGGNFVAHMGVVVPIALIRAGGGLDQ